MKSPFLDRRIFGRAGFWLAAIGLAGSAVARGREPEGASEEGAPRHRIALQISVNDPALMNLALTNIENIAAHYAAAGVAFAVDLTAFGPGYAMMRADTSPVKARITALKALHPSVTFSACQNARAAIAAREGRPASEIPQLPEARPVPAGVVHLSELQEQGWSYLRP